MRRFHVRDQRERLRELLAAKAAVHSVSLYSAIILLVSSKTVEPREAFAAFLADHALCSLLSFRQIVTAGNELEQSLRLLVLVLLLHEPIAQVRSFPCEERTVRVSKYNYVGFIVSRLIVRNTGQYMHRKRYKFSLLLRWQ